jgi:hypothetical protein
MRIVMKRIDPSWEEIDLDSNHRKELEELWKLKR